VLIFRKDCSSIDFYFQGHGRDRQAEDYRKFDEDFCVIAKEKGEKRSSAEASQLLKQVLRYFYLQADRTTVSNAVVIKMSAYKKLRRDSDQSQTRS
jgi:hypothetical protein